MASQDELEKIKAQTIAKICDPRNYTVDKWMTYLQMRYSDKTMLACGASPQEVEQKIVLYNLPHTEIKLEHPDIEEVYLKNKTLIDKAIEAKKKQSAATTGGPTGP